MYGLLHEQDGTPRIRTVRALKIGFGLPAGKDIYVYLRRGENPWAIQLGKAVQYFPDKQEAKLAYLKLRATATDRRYPIKLPFFTFSRLHPDGTYWPDFDAIDKHGPTPNEIDVVFLTNDPFTAQYEAWTAANLKCTGDGKNARRRCDWAHGPEERKQADKAKAAGYEWFPIVGGCFTGGCPFPKAEVTKEGKTLPPACKPHGRLDLQLANEPRIGGSCTYDTTGYRGVAQIYSSLMRIRTMTGNGEPERGTVAGIPMKLIMRPYKVTQPNGKPSMQFAVSLEIPAKNALELARMINRQADDYQAATRSHRRLTEADPGADLEDIQDAELVTPVDQPVEEQQPAERTEQQEAANMSAEFYGEFTDQPDQDFADLPLDEEDFAARQGSEEPAVVQTPVQQQQPPSTPAKLSRDDFSAAELGRMLRLARANNWNISSEAQLVELIGVWTGTRTGLMAALNNQPPKEG
jgi:hypothetical protein